jgi:thymidylate synthase (FAD)
MEAIKVLDHGFVRFVEAWGHGDAGYLQGQLTEDDNDYECGIIEAARQSTQASFRGWEDKPCTDCINGEVEEPIGNDGYGLITLTKDCQTCEGTGKIRGDARLLKYLFSNKPPHATPFEFAGVVIEVQAPIFVFREWHRHRTQSYNEMSARYAPLPDLNYVPTKERCFLNSKMNKQAGTLKGAAPLEDITCDQWLSDLRLLYERIQEHYEYGLQVGIPKEIARIDLPVGRYSRMRAQTNLRNWLAFMTLRADPGAMWEIQEFARAVGKILEAKFPRTWNLYVEGKK